jgi:hypothetical protein
MTINTKEYMRQYMRDYRKNKKHHYNNDIIPLWKKVDYKLTDKTIEQYVKTIIRITLKFKKSIPRDLQDILFKIFKEEADDNDYNYLISTLNFVTKNFINNLRMLYNNENTIKTNLMPFVRLFSLAKNDKLSMIYKKLSNEIIKINKEYELKRDDNTINEEDKNKIVSYDKEIILKNIEKIENIDDKAIYGLYTLLPPRRLEYSNVYLRTRSFYKKEDENKNYIIIFKKRPVQFVFNDYKTKKTFGRQEINIPEELGIILMEYIKSKKLKTGDKLFDYTSNYLGVVISKVLLEVYGEKMSLNYLRRSYATYMNTLNISNNEKEILSIMMGHSYNQNLKYRKIINMEEKK